MMGTIFWLSMMAFIAAPGLFLLIFGAIWLGFALAAERRNER